MGETQLDRVQLKRKDGESPDTLRCKFNPKEITISKSSTWRRSQNRGARNASQPEFVGTNPRTLKMNLLFDSWDTEADDDDVSKDVELLFDWTNPTEQSVNNNRPQPPLVVMHWGNKSYFEVYVKQVSAKYTMFDTKGVPVRATVTVTFEETPEGAEGQNPTSGGKPGQRTHTVTEGDSLQSIAYKEYGRADRWRAVAAFNGIDDPLRVPLGRDLLLPAAIDAEALAKG